MEEASLNETALTLDPNWAGNLSVCIRVPSLSGVESQLKGTLRDVFARIQDETISDVSSGIAGTIVTTAKNKYELWSHVSGSQEGNKFLELYCEAFHNHQVHPLNCYFFPVRRTRCLEDPIFGWEFFMASGSKIVKTFFFTADAPKFSQKNPKDCLWSGEWESHQAYVQMMYSKFFLETDQGRVNSYLRWGVSFDKILDKATATNIKDVQKSLNRLSAIIAVGFGFLLAAIAYYANVKK